MKMSKSAAFAGVPVQVRPPVPLIKKSPVVLGFLLFAYF